MSFFLAFLCFQKTSDKTSKLENGTMYSMELSLGVVFFDLDPKCLTL